MSIWDKLVSQIADQIVSKVTTGAVTAAAGPVAGNIAGKVAGNMAGKVADNMTSNNKPGPSIKTDKKTNKLLDAATGEPLRGSQGWDNPDAMLKPSAQETAILDVGLPVLGDIARGVGNVLGNKNSVLGAVLQAVNLSRGNPLGGDRMNDFVHTTGARNLSRGMNQKMIGDMAANRLYDTAATLKKEREGARNKAFQMNESAPGLFWEAQHRGQAIPGGWNTKQTSSNNKE